mgnify:CR=1 FL=1
MCIDALSRLRLLKGTHGHGPRRMMHSGKTAPRDRRFKEVDNGEDLYPEPDGTWRCCMTDAGVTVVATVMQHTMPCVGYCVEEPKGEDRLRVDLVGLELCREACASTWPG